MDILQIITVFSYPTAIFASFITLALLKEYTNLENRILSLIAVLTGILIVLLEDVFLSGVSMQKIVAGALSGLIADVSYEAIYKGLKK